MGQKILVIDNNAATRQLFSFLFAEAGWSPICYDYAHANLVIVQAFDPALIILDISDTQDEQGWEFLQRLQMEGTTAAIPILISTITTTFSLEIGEYLAAWGIRILHKPFELDTVIALIQHIFVPNFPSMLFSSESSLPILVVEDDEDWRDVIGTILRLEGYLVVTAVHGQVALDAVAHARYALILLDMMMPVMDGTAFLAAYAQYPKPHSPVIIYTADAAQWMQTLPSFVIGTLRKPFEVKELLSMVRRHAQHA